MAVLIDRPPGFGVRVLEPFNEKSGATAKKAALAAAAILGCGAAAAALVFGGAVIGAGVGVAGLAILGSSVLIDKAVVSAKKKSYAAEAALIEQRKEKELAAAGPGLGVESTADLRLSCRVEETLQWKLDLIKSAEKSIELSPNFGGGEPFQRILKAIQDRMAEKPDLKVHIIVSFDVLEKADKALLKDLKTQFGDRFSFLVTSKVMTLGASQENHVKLLLIDEKYFVMGGSNIDPFMTSETPVPVDPKLPLGGLGFRDMDIIGEGVVAKTMRQQFFALYHKWELRSDKKAKDRFFAIEGETEDCVQFFNAPGEIFFRKQVSFFVGGAEHKNANPIVKAVADRIEMATKKVRIASFVLNFPEQMRAALKAKKGPVKVIAYTTGANAKTAFWQKFLYGLFGVISLKNYDLFSEVHKSDVQDQFYHRKVITIDNRITVIGSSNFGKKSSELDDEVILCIEDDAITEAVIQSLKEDKERAIRVEKDALSVPKVGRVSSRAVNAVAGGYLA